MELLKHSVIELTKKPDLLQVSPTVQALRKTGNSHI